MWCTLHTRSTMSGLACPVVQTYIVTLHVHEDLSGGSSGVRVSERQVRGHPRCWCWSGAATAKPGVGQLVTPLELLCVTLTGCRSLSTRTHTPR
jgi:hypothetical protein